MRRRLLWAVVFLSLCAGCLGSSPDPNFYALYPQAGPTPTGVARADWRVEIRRPSLPGYLDRPHIVRRIDSGRLELSGNDRWGSPLEEMISATLAKNLAERVPGSSFFAEGGSISVRPDVVLEVEIQRFEVSSRGEMELIAQVALHWTERDIRPGLHRYVLSTSPESRGTGALVDSMSELLARLSDAIATSLANSSPSAATG